MDEERVNDDWVYRSKDKDKGGELKDETDWIKYRETVIWYFEQEMVIDNDLLKILKGKASDKIKVDEIIKEGYKVKKCIPNCAGKIHTYLKTRGLL